MAIQSVGMPTMLPTGPKVHVSENFSTRTPVETAHPDAISLSQVYLEADPEEMARLAAQITSALEGRDKKADLEASFDALEQRSQATQEGLDALREGLYQGVGGTFEDDRFIYTASTELTDNQKSTELGRHLGRGTIFATSKIPGISGGITIEVTEPLGNKLVPALKELQAGMARWPQEAKEKGLDFNQSLRYQEDKYKDFMDNNEFFKWWNAYQGRNKNLLDTLA